MSETRAARRGWWSHIPYLYFTGVYTIMLVLAWLGSPDRWRQSIVWFWGAVITWILVQVVWRAAMPVFVITPTDVTYRHSRGFRKSVISFADVVEWRRERSEFLVTARGGRTTELDLGELSDAEREAVGSELETRLREAGGALS